MELAQLGNVYFDSKRPWQDAKKPETRSTMETTIRCCLECLKTLALISFPVIPDTANKLWHLLGYPSDLGKASWNEVLKSQLPEGQKMSEPKILFSKIEDGQIAEEIAKLHALSAQHAPEKKVDYAPLRELIEIDDFRKIDLRVGVILSAIAVPKSKKLLQLEVDLGFEKRTIVSGISQHYKPEDVVGKKVIVVANLKPATLMGVQSHGMILAGSWDTDLKVLQADDLPPGSVIS
jgi:methionyl-tRNA synthetase